MSALGRWWRARRPVTSDRVYPTPVGPAEARAALATFTGSIRDQVPGQVLERVERIAALIDEALPTAASSVADPAGYYPLVRTATTYLPDTVGAYLALPRSFANHHRTNGRTALESLCEQLDLLAATVAELVEDVRRRNQDRLAANGRFLEDKFGKGTLELPGSGADR
jgi:hypothetical protein